jgi:signal transduction histidine kinase
MARGGKLSIAIAQSAKTERDGLKIVVNDTGHGISREHLGKVFEPFFTTKGNLGTGIGLWVTRQLVERHGGHISISSSTEPGNSGTIVMIDLPFDNSGDANSANTGQLGSSAEIR